MTQFMALGAATAGCIMEIEGGKVGKPPSDLRDQIFHLTYFLFVVNSQIYYYILNRRFYMKNRDPYHDDWMTPPTFYEQQNAIYQFDFDPCPWMHDMSWDGLEVDWGRRNFVNPPYSLKLKEAFILKAIKEAGKGKFSRFLLPVSTSTKLFHDIILPNKKGVIEFVKGRLLFIGRNKKGQYCNFHLVPHFLPPGEVSIKQSGQQDSMLINFG
jgi:hypothetical protein